MTVTDQLVEIPDDILSYLGTEATLTLATASRNGVPHGATHVYVTEGAIMYVCMRADTVTARNIEQNPLVFITVDSYNQDWSKTKGIQCSAEAERLTDPDKVKRIAALFHQKFPAVAEVPVDRLTIYRLTPTSIVYIDNEVEGGPTPGIECRENLVYDIFHDLPRHEVDTVAAQLATIQVAAGEVVVRQGESADRFFIVQDGEVEVIRNDSGQARTVARLQTGQFFGEMAILRDMPRTATVRAVRPSTLLAMDKEAFRALVAQSLATSEDFDQVIQRRFSELTHRRIDAD
jgi:CRP-like cAMP-binding protein